jgi:hypothetical protein
LPNRSRITLFVTPQDIGIDPHYQQHRDTAADRLVEPSCRSRDSGETGKIPTNIIMEPPTRCVRVHTVSLPSVHGVLIPKRKFDLNRGSRFPGTRNRAPMAIGATRPTAIGQPNAEAMMTTWIAHITTTVAITTRSQVFRNLAISVREYGLRPELAVD